MRDVGPIPPHGAEPPRPRARGGIPGLHTCKYFLNRMNDSCMRGHLGRSFTPPAGSGEAECLHDGRLWRTARLHGLKLLYRSVEPGLPQNIRQRPAPSRKAAALGCTRRGVRRHPHKQSTLRMHRGCGTPEGRRSAAGAGQTQTVTAARTGASLAWCRRDTMRGLTRRVAGPSEDKRDLQEATSPASPRRRRLRS